MCYELSKTGEQISVTLTGTIGVREATSLRQQLFPLMRQGFASVDIQLSEVTDMDSSGLGLLSAVKKIADDCNANVTFHDVPDRLRGRLIQTGIPI
ncbi:STAS domain-containing protein [Cohnella terricola]|uniref:STAS domain-containing protein n=1 Tax=Cohnella terricola TaxID=1289167 RepID=A0A559JAG5_9BACL|nr:STAS domain-containing protein [Cohnella terricola]TVX96875.1 STAS domain-containing protein [Cohnella terricola]